MLGGITGSDTRADAPADAERSPEPEPQSAPELTGCDPDGAGNQGDARPEPAGGPEPELEREQWFLGRIKSFSSAQGFGFIQCPEIAERFGCDAFLNHPVEGGVVVGGLVSFCVELGPGGKPQARRIALQQADGRGRSDPVAANVEYAWRLEGRLFEARVKSFNIARGFGFVQPTPGSELHHALSGRDVYVSAAQVPGGSLHAGQLVHFCLAFDRMGQPQARNVQFPRPLGLFPPQAASPVAVF